MDTVSSMEILAHRLLWGFIFVYLIMSIQSKKRVIFFTPLKEFKVNFKQFSYIFAASLAISANWLIFIWVVNRGYIMEASLGLYITPIVSKIFGVLLLKDTLQSGTLISMIMAFGGVMFLTYDYGKFPWVAISFLLHCLYYCSYNEIINCILVQTFIYHYY
ncbi:EamA family transporter [Rummeliibacillus sp. JY-2-4R]